MSDYNYVVLGYVIFVALNVVDWFFTRAILRHPTGKEFNPVMVVVHRWLGMAGMAYVKILVLGLLGVQVAVANIDLWTIWYLDFMFVVLLSIMYWDGVKVGVRFTLK